LIRTKQFLHDVRYSLWFLPAIIVACAALLAIFAVELDTKLNGETLLRWPWLSGVRVDGARDMLQSVASAMIIVAALTFSVAALIISSGAKQYTPRLIGKFMGSRVSQTVLGILLGVFVYCIIVMRSIGSGADALIPSIAVTTAVLLSLVAVGFLVFFIHHVTSSVQASTVVSTVAAETMETIDAVFRESAEGRYANELFRRSIRAERYEWSTVCSLRTGYVQTVDRDALVEFAKQYLLIVKMEKAPGEFVARGMPLASITMAPSRRMILKLNSLYAIGHHRTAEQDPGVGIRQLGDIALRAMSPAINDTTTAVMCIDYLSSILIKMAPRRIAPDPAFINGELVLIPKGPDFGDFLREAFEQIREHATGNVAIYVRLLEALEILACFTSDACRKKEIAEQIRLVSDYARCNVQFPDQLKKIEAHRSDAMRHCLDEATMP
jgi:uncharacterized membrane protein